MHIILSTYVKELSYFYQSKDHFPLTIYFSFKHKQQLKQTNKLYCNMKLSVALPRQFYFPQSSAYSFGYRPRQQYFVHVRPQPSMVETVRTLQAPIDALFQDPFELDSFYLRESALMRRKKQILASFLRDFDNTADLETKRKTLSARREVTEKPDSFDISVALPTGMEAKDISLELLHNDRVLYLSGEKKVEKDNTFSQSRIGRMFKMSNNADTNKISAKLSEGVLHVTVPKLEKKEEKQSKKIDIVQDSPAPVTTQAVENKPKEHVKEPTPDDVGITKSESVESDNEDEEFVKVEDDNDEADAKTLDTSKKEE